MRSITSSDSRADLKSSLLSRFLLAPLASLVIAMGGHAGPVTAIAWSPVDASVRQNVESMVLAFSGANPRVIAQQLKAKPAGRRVLALLDYGERIATHPQDACRAPDGKGGWKLTTWRGPWTSAGAVEVRRTVETFFTALKAEGAVVDMLVLDEETDFSALR